MHAMRIGIYTATAPKAVHSAQLEGVPVQALWLPRSGFACMTFRASALYNRSAKRQRNTSLSYSTCQRLLVQERAVHRPEPVTDS